MKRTISIIGPIGSFRYKDKDIKGVQLVDVIANVSKLPDDTKELIVEVGSLGGSVPVAKAIRGYLKSLQPRIAVTTKQVDDIASAGTIVFSAGSKRSAAKGINPNTGKAYQMMVHNSWITEASGNADHLGDIANGLRLTDDEMIEIYHEDTGITREAIMPLMKAESFMTTQNAIDLKFATETYEAQPIAAFHNANKNMSKEKENSEDKTLLAQITEYIKSIGGKGKIVAAAPPAELMGKPVAVDGKPAVDGVYTVVGGVITALESVQEEAAEAKPAAAPAAGQPAAMAEVLALLKAQPKQDEIIAAAVAKAKEESKAEILALKKLIKVEHVPVGFTPETKADDIKEWERSYKANEHLAMKKNEPEKFQRLFFAKYGKMPNM